MDFESALAYLQNLQKFGIKLGNERMEAILSRLDDPHQHYTIAHVTGTKGKGSTTAMIASILQAHGLRTGAYYSPYVYDVCERVQVDGQYIPRDDFARLTTKIAPIIEDIARTELGQATEFELKTALGFQYFAEREVEFAAIEVGIGGRLDATNVVEPAVCVITNVGLDHMHILGNTHEKIAVEKAGIIKPCVPVITAADHPGAFEVIRDVAHRMRAELRVVCPEQPGSAQASGRITWTTGTERFSIRTERASYADLTLQLLGEFQRSNAACAVAAVEEIGNSRGFDPDPDRVREGLHKAYVPGRFEIVHSRPKVILDGSHNAMAARALAGEIQKLSYENLLLVIGMVTGHEPDAVISELAPLARKVYATRPTWNRGLPACEIAAVARKYCPDVEVITPPLDAARAALSAAGLNDLVLITGSFYVVGDVPPDALLNQ